MIRLTINSQKHGEVYKDFSTQEELDAYIAEVTESKHWGEFTHTSQDLTAQLLLEKEKAEAAAYLKSTDWYVVRNAETGVAVPNDVTTKRAEARLKL